MHKAKKRKKKTSQYNGTSWHTLGMYVSVGCEMQQKRSETYVVANTFASTTASDSGAIAVAEGAATAKLDGCQRQEEGLPS